MAKTYKTPGVYIEEKNAFPYSVVPVATAMPAFIGYTEKATYLNKDLTNIPTRISSFAEYEMYYGGGPKTLFHLEYDPNSNPVYSLTTGPRFLLFLSMKMFFANGGSECYIVSVGDYSNGLKFEDFDNEAANQTRRGLSALQNVAEPTLLVIPEAVSLEESECYRLQQSVLKHCGGRMLNRMGIFDIYGGFQKRTYDDGDVVKRFRNGIGMDFLPWGAAYYPWLNTSITQVNDIDFTYIAPSSIQTLVEILTSEVEKAEQANLLDEAKANMIRLEINKLNETQNASPETPAQVDNATLHQTLLTLSPLYKSVLLDVVNQINLLPPSAAMAGIYSMVDNTRGVFTSPANVSIASVISPAVVVTNNEQEDYNTPLDGKAVNTIRFFVGKGVLVWGARTLDGNSQDWRYISVRRTVIFLEQSVKYAIQPLVLEPNVPAIWTAIKAMISSFLTNFWKQGGLVGIKPDEAFRVQIGLGETMTEQDILDGYYRITILVALTRPAEFIVINILQQMERS